MSFLRRHDQGHQRVTAIKKMAESNACSGTIARDSNMHFDKHQRWWHNSWIVPSDMYFKQILSFLIWNDNTPGTDICVSIVVIFINLWVCTATNEKGKLLYLYWNCVLSNASSGIDLSNTTLLGHGSTDGQFIMMHRPAVSHLVLLEMGKGTL